MNNTINVGLGDERKLIINLRSNNKFNMNLILILTYNIILTGLEMIQIMAFGQNLKEKRASISIWQPAH